MRLINTSTLALEEFFGSKIPEYAILSHTWEDNEISFQQLQAGITTRPGNDKIVQTCRIARSQGIGWTWIDTCCIDKSSSAELTEAINSMFKWYENASICYAVLSDCATEAEVDFKKGLEQSKWITRGWTLQELIAPRKLMFFDSSWAPRGMRSKLIEDVASVTGIDRSVLAKWRSHSDYTVGRIMTWASKRQTTREEDMAYCLLGLFGVHMPLLYGEGAAAFIRLQEEIIKRVDDLSIFAWFATGGSGRYSGILAESPSQFSVRYGKKYDNISNKAKPLATTKDFAITNKGLRITTGLLELPRLRNIGSELSQYILPLDIPPAYRVNRLTGIYLREMDDSVFVRQHWSARELPGYIYDLPSRNLSNYMTATRIPEAPIYILAHPSQLRQYPNLERKFDPARDIGLRIPLSSPLQISQVSYNGFWDPVGRIFTSLRSMSMIAAFVLRPVEAGQSDSSADILVAQYLAHPYTYFATRLAGSGASLILENIERMTLPELKRLATMVPTDLGCVEIQIAQATTCALCIKQGDFFSERFVGQLHVRRQGPALDQQGLADESYQRDTSSSSPNHFFYVKNP
ncbi:HET-domain-containing protein [Zalerion maritima]|uniref:HET-domain-containing protein n=1 Tax=Zalerion maritima TaxID=339359 RepID=A0AAD5WPD4_9PEZI|nr:HET-domain-containing protein [Zalerion maritima]